MANPKFHIFTQTLAKHFNISPETLLASFRPAVEADFISILEFRKKHLGSTIYWNDEKYFRWRYSFANEIAPAHAETHPRELNRLWVLVLDGKLLAILGRVQVPLHCAQQKIVATHPLDVLVDESIDGLGVGAWMQFVFNESVDAMLVIGANARSSSIVKRIFHRMPDRQVWKLAISSFPLLHRYLKNAWCAKTLSTVSDAGMMLFRYARHFLFSNKAYRLERIEKFDQRVDAVSKSWIGKANFHERSADYLNWRFFENPNKSYEAFGLFEQDQCLAYAIVHRSQVNNTHYLLIDDFCWMQNQDADRILFSLLNQLIRWCQANRLDILVLYSYGAFAQPVLKQHRFIERSENLLMSVSCNIPQLETQLYNPDQWFITAADAHGAGN